MNPSFLVTPLSEFDTERFQRFVLTVAFPETAEEESGNMEVQVPDPREVLLCACSTLLGLTREQCTLLFQEVPETNTESDEYRAIVRRLYAPDSWCADTETRVAASQIAVINAVIARYNSKIT